MNSKENKARWDNAIAKLSNDDWGEIEAINSQIRSHIGPWGKIEVGDKDESGVIQMPYASPDPLISKFIELWYDKGLVVSFDWSEWDEGREWYANTDTSKYDSLGAETALKLLTAVIRNDRFNEGALVNSFESGDFPKIINKFVSLRGNN